MLSCDSISACRMDLYLGGACCISLALLPYTSECVCAWCPNGFGTHHRHHVKLSYCWATRVLSCSADNGYTKYKESENSRKQRKEIIFFYFLFILIGENVKRWNANAAQTTRQMSGWESEVSEVTLEQQS